LKIEYLADGDIVVSKGCSPILVVFGISIFLLLSKDAFIWLFTAQQIHGSRFLALLMIALTILLFYRVFSLRSRFYFSSTEKKLCYKVEHIFSNKRGSIPIDLIEQAFVEADDDSNSRIVIKCKNKNIPMSATVESLGKNDSTVMEINAWLEKNT